MKPFDCDQARERLPWLWNGTLDREESAMVQAHLEGCDACRRELEETAWLAAGLDEHPPADWIAAHALGQPLEFDARQVVQDHIATCSACRADWEAAAAARSALARELAPKPSPWLAVIAASAVLGAIAAGYGWFRTQRQMEGLAADSQALRRKVESLERAASARPEPRAGIVAVDLFPVTQVRRGEQPPVAEVTAGAAAVLFLNSPVAPETVEIRRAGAVVWTGPVTQTGSSSFAVWIPPGFLEAGAYELRSGADLYRLTVKNAP